MRKPRHREVKEHGQDHRISTSSWLAATHPSCASTGGSTDRDAVVYNRTLMLVVQT